MAKSIGKMWPCHRCGRLFANKNQIHSCGSWTVDEHFVGNRSIRGDGEAQRAGAAASGEDSDRRLIARMNFASATPAKDRLRCHLVVPKKIHSPRIVKTETYRPNQHAIYFAIRSPEELDDDLQGWIDQAYRMGMQEFLTRTTRK
jgi:hypothetical protein